MIGKITVVAAFFAFSVAAFREIPSRPGPIGDTVTFVAVFFFIWGILLLRKVWHE